MMNVYGTNSKWTESFKEDKGASGMTVVQEQTLELIKQKLAEGFILERNYLSHEFSLIKGKKEHQLKKPTVKKLIQLYKIKQISNTQFIPT